jgi:hypothetical protein
LNSIADFTRFRDKGAQGAELQTAIISYRKHWKFDLIGLQENFQRNFFFAPRNASASFDIKE